MKQYRTYRIKLAFSLFLGCVFCSGRLPAEEKMISVVDYGLSPGNGRNGTVIIRQIFSENQGEDSLYLVFPQGRYDFYPDSINGSNVGFKLDKRENITIEGNASEFVFHGQMNPFGIAGSENINLKNFSIDWDRPYISQAQVCEITNKYVDIRIDKRVYPYHIENGKLVFVGEGWKLGVSMYEFYDKDNREIVYRTHDDGFGKDFFAAPAEEIGDGLIRIHKKPKRQVEAGTYVSLLHTRYLSNCISIELSKNINLSDIQIYHSPSMGVRAVRSENIRLERVNVTANTKKDRVFSAIADAFHFAGCKGDITVEECSHSGQADDFMNVHGEYYPVTKQINDSTLLVPLKGRNRNLNYLLGEDDQIWLVDQKTMQRSESFQIVNIRPVYEAGNLVAHTLTTDKKLPEMQGKYFIENAGWNPTLTVRNCKILKKNRARGILVTTPRKVIIENNYFRTAGAAILIEGDTDFWLESGACEEVLIRNNVFENCFTSGEHWGESIISITPSYRPLHADYPAYHRNICIENNQFRHFDASVLYARSVENLFFKQNRLERTYDYRPFSRKPAFFFDGCRKVFIHNNLIDDYFLNKRMVTKNMKSSDTEIIHTNINN